jgi:methylmalonyl-CoA mutase C-terminal domain/subunit
MSEQPHIKAIAAKIGLDGHYRGIKFVVRSLTQMGAEVVYLGANQQVDQVVTAAVHEDAQLVALSFLSPDYRQHVPELMKQLKAAGAGHVVVVVGGLISNSDLPMLTEAGVRKVFGPGTTSKDIADFVKETFSGAPTRA